MPFTADQLANMANAALDFYMKGPALSQVIQDKPLLKALRGAQKTFPGGKSDIRGNVKGTYTTEFEGYTHDQSVTYQNPANIKQFNYPWREHHAGIGLTLTELKHDGISVVDSLNGENTSNHSQREMTVITGLLEDKLEDMGEGSMQSFNNILWLDGTQDALVIPGVQSIVADDPTTGIVAGIDRAQNTWWRNRARTAASGGVITHSTTNQTLTKTLRSEVRQLRRYGGRPSLVLAGSGFIEKLEAEVHEKGSYTESGFANNGTNDIGMADISMRGVGRIQYDPSLDDLSLENYCYFLDTRHLYLSAMSGEDMKQHAPARPAEKYVLYRAVTYTGALVCRKMNAHGVYVAA